MLTLQQANTIISAALAKSRERGFQPMGIAVLDASGNLKAFVSEDGASMFRFDIARAKAWGAVGMGVSSRVLGQRAKDNPNFFVSLSATSAWRRRGWSAPSVVPAQAGTQGFRLGLRAARAAFERPASPPARG